MTQTDLEDSFSLEDSSIAVTKAGLTASETVLRVSIASLALGEVPLRSGGEDMDPV